MTPTYIFLCPSELDCEQNLPEEMELLGVDQFEWLGITGGAAAETGGLGPCIGIAILDLSQHLGWLAHLPTICPDGEGGIELKEMLKDAASRCQVTNTKIVLTGGSLELAKHDKHAEKYTLDARKFAENISRQYFPQNQIHLA